MSTKAFLTGQVLRWARERDGLSRELAARTVNVTPGRIQAWEEERERPTINQAQTLAHRYNIPFGYLFLSEPPIDSLPLPDLRTVAGQPPRKPSPELLWTLRDAISKHDWYREYLELANAESLAFVASFSHTSSPLDIAESIRTTFAVNDEMRRKANTWERFLTLFVRQSEEQGVIVLRNGVVGNNTSRSLNVAEFRGFAISDDLAPLVFINSKDAKAAQIFTLAHEIAHLWIGESGVSNPDYRRKSDSQANDVERLCNRVAAELLVPAQNFRAQWDSGADIPTNVDRFGRLYKVSRFVVLRQAYDLGMLNDDTYWAYYEDFLKASHRADSESAGNFYTNLLARSSRKLTIALLSALAEGSVSYREASRLLNVRVGKLDSLPEHLS